MGHRLGVKTNQVTRGKGGSGRWMGSSYLVVLIACQTKAPSAAVAPVERSPFSAEAAMPTTAAPAAARPVVADEAPAEPVPTAAGEKALAPGRDAEPSACGKSTPGARAGRCLEGTDKPIDPNEF